MTAETKYSTQDVVDALRQIGIQSGDVVYLAGNLGNLGFHESKSKAGTLRGHLDALKGVVGDLGTIVVPTHSFSLCNTDIPFDIAQTPSERGAFTEFVRQQPGAVRQFHPFASLTALGRHAEEICGRTTRHAYGPNTPYERLLGLNAWGISIGMPPRLTCSIIHHLEQVMAVPYRYTKEFFHPIRRGNAIGHELFYLFVTYRQCEVIRDRNEKLFKHSMLASAARSVPVGIGQIHGYRLCTLRDAAVELMSADIYNWLASPPSTRPYQA